MPIGLGGGEQAHDRGGTAAGRFRADEEPVLAPERDRPDRVLDPVVVDRIAPAPPHRIAQALVNPATQQIGIQLMGQGH